MFKHEKNLLKELYFNLSTPGDQHFNANNPAPPKFDNPNQPNPQH